MEYMSRRFRSRKTEKTPSRKSMLQSLFKRRSNPEVEIQITEEKPEIEPVVVEKQKFEPKDVENPEIIDLTSENYKLFNNKFFKDSSIRYYNTLSGTAKENYESEEINNIDLIENMETLPIIKLFIIYDNLISFNAKQYFQYLLIDKGLFYKWQKALYERDWNAPPLLRGL